MKITFNKPYPLLIGLLIILAVNGVVFFKVAYNRTGTPLATISMTERELSLPYWDRFKGENSAVHMNLNWRTLSLLSNETYPYRQADPDWIDAEMLARLGFDLSLPTDSPKGRRYYNKLLPKEVIWVLEFDGETYQEALKRVRERLATAEEQAAQWPENEQHQRTLREARRRYEEELHNSSRLFVIDLATDLHALRVKYKDPSRYLFLRGQVGIHLHTQHPHSEVKLYGRLRNLTIGSVNVPVHWHTVLDSLPERDQPTRREERKPRYQAILALGQSLEPWLLDIHPIDVVNEQTFQE